MIAVAAAAGTLLVASGLPARADTVRDAQWHLTFLDVAGAQRLSQGAGVIVAVIDSGVEATHPDLVGNVLPGIDVSGGVQTPNPGGAGQVDVDGRGTGLAGLIAGHGRGSGTDGVLGIAPQARILPIRITNRPAQFGDPDVLAEGIAAAVASGAKVICIGRGMPTSPRLEQAVASAILSDVVVVAATASRRGETFLPWPAGYPGVVAVTPVDQAGELADPPPSPPPPLGLLPQATPILAAPGVNLVTTGIGGGYQIDAGSGAAALVAGAAALVRARYPQLPADEVIHRLTVTAKDRGRPGRDAEYGFGIVDLGAALAEDVPPLHPLPSGSPTLRPVPTPAIVPVAVSPTPGPQVALPAFDSRDWRRWLVALPLVAFIVCLVAYATTGRRRRRTP